MKIISTRPYSWSTELIWVRSAPFSNWTRWNGSQGQMLPETGPKRPTPKLHFLNFR
jgi:hypothetical protein